MIDFFTGDEGASPHQIVLSILGFAIGDGGAHDHFAVSVKSADFKAGFGFDGFIVVGQGIKAASDGAEDGSLTKIIYGRTNIGGVGMGDADFDLFDAVGLSASALMAWSIMGTTFSMILGRRCMTICWVLPLASCIFWANAA